MAFKLGDVIIDRLQFGYGATKTKALYALTQLTNATIDITADSTDIKDKDGNLIYRKYSGKSGEVTATNAFMNLSVIEAISAQDAEIASDTNMTNLGLQAVLVRINTQVLNRILIILLSNRVFDLCSLAVIVTCGKRE